MIKEMIKTEHCQNCDKEIDSESEIVFCNEKCLDEYIEDMKSLEKYKEE